MTEYDKLNEVFEKILNEDDRYSLDPKVLAARLVGKNRGIAAADTESRNIFINEFLSQGLSALQSAISSGMIGPNNSISDFMVNWFNTYMRGSQVNSNMAPDQIKAVADRIEQAYKKEQGGSLFRRQGEPGKETRTEVARLGHLGWSLYHTRMGARTTAAGSDPSTTPTDRPRGGVTPPGPTDTGIDNRIDISALRQGVQGIVGMINKFDQATKRKAISAILQNTNMLANVDQIVDAIAADKMNRFELEALIKAAQNKLGNENPAQGDLLAVGANDNTFPKPANVTPIGQGRNRRT